MFRDCEEDASVAMCENAKALLKLMFAGMELASSTFLFVLIILQAWI